MGHYLRLVGQDMFFNSALVVLRFICSKKIKFKEVFMENSKKILIANDNAEESKLISEKLTNEENEFEIDVVSSGTKAIELMTNKTYDLLIVDLVLPEVDGFEVIERVKEISNSTKIIVISALASEIFIKKATSFGASYYT